MSERVCTIKEDKKGWRGRSRPDLADLHRMENKIPSQPDCNQKPQRVLLRL